MEYNSKSLTREGATMLALADQEEKALIIDEVIVSEKVITAGTDISTLTMADFTSPLTYGISSKVQSDNQFSVKSVITNHWQDSANTDHTTNKDFNVALVGVVAHVDGYVDQHVLTVAVGNDPFVLPAYQGTDVSFVFGITQAYSASQNVTIKMDGSAYALATDLDDVKNLQGSIGIAIDSKLKDYAKKDEVQNLIPDDIATTKNLADGDATTLKSAKEYADTQASDKVKTSDIDPSVMAKTTLTANDDVLALGPGTYYTWGVKPNNFPALAPWSTVVVKTVGNQPMDGKNVTITDTNAFQLVNTYSGNPPTGKWSGWRVPNSTTMASKTDVTTATANMVHRNPDTGSVSEPVDFTNLTVNGGKSVATSDDLKSLEASAWLNLGMPKGAYLNTTGETTTTNLIGEPLYMKFDSSTGITKLSGGLLFSPSQTLSSYSTWSGELVTLPNGFDIGNDDLKEFILLLLSNNVTSTTLKSVSKNGKIISGSIIYQGVSMGYKDGISVIGSVGANYRQYITNLTTGLIKKV